MDNIPHEPAAPEVLARSRKRNRGDPRGEWGPSTTGRGAGAQRKKNAKTEKSGRYARDDPAEVCRSSLGVGSLKASLFVVDAPK